MGVEPNDLAGALASHQFFLAYQPTIDLETNAFAGVEALIRWRHPTRGVLGPDTFITKLEESGEIVPVGRWALRTACLDGASWHDKGYRFNVSVNISSRQLDDGQFGGDVIAALDESRFEASLLVLEFAQSVLSGCAPVALDRLSQIRERGVRIAVDDFSPGASSLEVLETFGVDIVKLDRDFTATLARSANASSQIHSLIQLSESRRVQVIAAGVEDLDQRAALQNEKVHVGQGYLFSKPHEAQDIDLFLEDFAIFSGKPL